MAGKTLKTKKKWRNTMTTLNEFEKTLLKMFPRAKYLFDEGIGRVKIAQMVAMMCFLDEIAASEEDVKMLKYQLSHLNKFGTFDFVES
jgi:hypothetical protein